MIILMAMTGGLFYFYLLRAVITLVTCITTGQQRNYHEVKAEYKCKKFHRGKGINIINKGKKRYCIAVSTIELW
jgi:hypothetical protein